MRLILPILFILISVGTFIFGLNPFYKEVKALKADIVEYNKALDNSTNLQKREDALITSLNSIKQSDKNRLYSFLPSTVNNIQFILEMERIANLHNMPIKDIKFEAKKTVNIDDDPNIIVSAEELDDRPFGVFPIEFTTEGDYDSFVLFLKDLEFNLRLADVRSVSFTSPDPSSKPIPGIDPNIYRYSLKVETYWLK